MFFDELNNDEWALLAALVSDEPAVRLNRRGRPRAEPRIVANAVLWILSTGEPWSKLPGRYPSGPTCRRRFEEWQLNGTLAEMIRLLTQVGRTFVYVPQASPPVAAKPAPQPVAASVRDDSPRGVSWKSPESWQTPAGGSPGSRTLDPLADMTRQLSGGVPEEEARAEPASNPASVAGVPAPRRQGLGISPASLATRSTQTFAWGGYMIHVAAETVPNAMYRAWAEIEKDGRRVERSGLVGPRFAESKAAQEFALEWARQWIDRQCRTVTAAANAATNAATNAHASNPYSRPLPSARSMPNAATVTSSGIHADTPPTTGSINSMSGPLHAPLNSGLGAPLNSSVNALRAPLRRYPGEAASDSVAERFPAATEYISHAG